MMKSKADVVERRVIAKAKKDPAKLDCRCLSVHAMVECNGYAAKRLCRNVLKSCLYTSMRHIFSRKGAKKTLETR